PRPQSARFRHGPVSHACDFPRYARLGEEVGYLGVLPTDVVNTADRWPVADRAVRSPVVVGVEPVWQGGVAVSMGAVAEPVRPFARHRLVEALHLPVGAGTVGLGGEVADAAAGEQLAQ